MNKLDLLPLTDDQREQILFEAKQYLRFSHIKIRIELVDDRVLAVCGEQVALVNGSYLTKKEIHDRVLGVFKDHLPGWKIYVSPVYFNRDDIDSINSAWLNANLDRFKLKLKHIRTYTGIDTSTLSLLKSGDKEFTKWHKVAMYYFFKYYENLPKQ